MTPHFRPIHYLGSKLRLASAIRNTLSLLDPSSGTVCDLFAGSGTVALALSADRAVVASDIQEYSRVLCSAVLRPAELTPAGVASLSTAVHVRFRELLACVAPIAELESLAINRAGTDPAALCDLVEYGLVVPAAGGAIGAALADTTARLARYPRRPTVTRLYGGVYFSYHQAAFLDAALDAIDESPAASRDTFRAAVVSTASDLVNSVGKQFAQPMRPRRADGSVKPHLIRQMCRDRSADPTAVFDGWLARYQSLPRGGPHRVVRGDFRQVLAELNKVAVVYADPPYTRDHYSRFYHVLETICRRDDPGLSPQSVRGRTVSRGLYRLDRHQSPFCIKSQAPEAFADLFRGVRGVGVPLLVSYSPYLTAGHPRLMTVEGVVAIAQQYFGAVEVVPARPLTHSKLNKMALHREASASAEIFIACRP